MKEKPCPQKSGHQHGQGGCWGSRPAVILLLAMILGGVDQGATGDQSLKSLATIGASFLANSNEISRDGERISTEKTPLIHADCAWQAGV
jgi:hypothetical protein